MLASLALAWTLSGDHVQFAAGQAALFALFAVASLTLFGAMIMDFDKWVESVPPVPKRVLRRWFARCAEKVGRLVVRGLARYRAAMTCVWVPTGRALVWMLDRYGTVLTWLWTRIVRAGAWALAAYCSGLTWLWTRIGRAGVWAFVSHGRVLSWLWSTTGRGT